MNITPTSNISYSRNNMTKNNIPPKPQNPAFGMRIDPNIDNLSGILKNYKADSTAQFAIPHFLAETIKKHFNNNTLSDIFQEAIFNKGAAYADKNVKDFIPDFDDKVIPLSFRTDEEGLKGTLGNSMSEIAIHGDVIGQRNWIEQATKNREIFHKPLVKMTKEYARRMLTLYDINNKHY